MIALRVPIGFAMGIAGVAGFAEHTVREWVAAGAVVVGGCCGIGPAGVAGVAEALARQG